MLINLIVESLHKVYIYKIIMLYTLNVLQFCQPYFKKDGGNKKAS